MNGADWITRLLLAGILVLQVGLVVQGRGGSQSPVLGRYQVMGMRAGAPVLIRTDTETGQVWKLELRGGGGLWVPFSEPDAEGESQASGRESQDAGESAAVRREIVEPPGAPPVPKPQLVLPAPPVPSTASPAAQPEQEIVALRTAITNPELPIEMRVWAAQRLVSMDDPRAGQALIEALGDPDAAVAFAAVEALNESDSPEVREALEKLREAGDETVRERLETVE